jgi:hypothetical protein
MSDSTDANRPTDSVDLARLTAADPASSAADPDLTALRERVLAEAQDEAQSPGRDRRRLIEFGVAAAVVLLAAGTLAGLALGRATGNDPILAIADETVDVPAVNSEPAVAPDRMMSPGSGAPMVENAAATSMIWPGYAEGFEPAPGLSDTPGTADGYRLNGESVDRGVLAEQLADVFGVAGSATETDGVVTVGSPDGSGPSVWVYNDASVSWSFANNTRDPWACSDSATSSGGASVDGEPGSIEPYISEPGVPEPCVLEGESMPEAEAVAMAEQILSALGVSASPGLDVGIDWESFDDGAVTTATAWQTIDGERTQLSWSITFDAQGPLWANGFAAGLQVVTDYPIVGARTAVLRSAQPQWRAFGPTPVDPVVMPMDMPRVLDDDPVDSTTSPAAGTPASDDIPIVWDPAVVTDAEETLAQYWGPDGQFWLLPGYRLSTAEDRGTWVIIAVDQSAVTFTSAR